jgi:hypothetical protein
MSEMNKKRPETETLINPRFSPPALPVSYLCYYLSTPKRIPLHCRYRTKWRLVVLERTPRYQYPALREEGRWNVYLYVNIANEGPVRIQYNCLVPIYTASLFPNQNYNVLSPNFHIHVFVSDLYIPRTSLPILLQPDSRNI